MSTPYVYFQDCHCYRKSLIEEERKSTAAGSGNKVKVSAEMRRQIRQHRAKLVGRDTFALPIECKSSSENK